MLRLFVTSLVLLSVAIATVTVNCSPTPLNPDCTCSMQFVQLTVTAVDALNNPVTDLDIVVEVTRTGELLDVMQSDNLRENGEYVIFDDGFRNAIPPKIAALGEALEVMGTGSSGDFAAQYEVSVDLECRCHVFKLSGPDTVTVD